MALLHPQGNVEKHLIFNMHPSFYNITYTTRMNICVRHYKCVHVATRFARKNTSPRISNAQFPLEVFIETTGVCAGVGFGGDSGWETGGFG